MSELADFQDAFAAALRGAELPPRYGPPAGLAAGLTVYRNTVFKGALDALAANYPTVRRLVGEAWFAAAAGAFLEQTWPDEAPLAAFGAGFPTFLAALPQASDLPYLPDVARIDRLWTEAHLAADAEHLTAAALAAVAPDALPAVRLKFVPSVRLAWFETPAPSIWLAHRDGAGPDLSDLAWRPEGLLLARPYGGVEAVMLDRVAYAFADALRGGQSLGDAAATVLGADPLTDVAARLATLLTIGALSRPSEEMSA